MQNSTVKYITDIFLTHQQEEIEITNISKVFFCITMYDDKLIQIPNHYTMTS